MQIIIIAVMNATLTPLTAVEWKAKKFKVERDLNPYDFYVSTAVIYQLNCQANWGLVTL